MPLGTFDTHDLIRVIETVKPDIQPYWLTMFPGQINFDQEYIDFDVVDQQNRRLAPFVSPLAQGKVQKELGFSTKRFKPAYIKPKDVVDPTKLLKRRAGEALMGSLSMEARREAYVTQKLLEHREMIDRRMEWMAANAIINGSVTVSGEDYPTQVVDFQRNANRTVTLSGGALWTAAGTSDPYANFETWFQLIQSTTGYVVDRITMGTTAWNALRAHALTIDRLDTNFLGSSLQIDRDPLVEAQIVRQVGRVSGVPIYVYSQVYTDDAGNNVNMLDQRDVVLTASRGVEGVRCFGGIMDKKAGYQPLTYFVKMWEQEDPSVEYLMTQSAPLMVPMRADCTLRARVTA